MHISLSIYIYISLLFASLKFHLKDAKKKKEKEEKEGKKLGTKIREGKHEDPHKYQRGNITHGAPVEKVF